MTAVAAQPVNSKNSGEGSKVSQQLAQSVISQNENEQDLMRLSVRRTNVKKVQLLAVENICADNFVGNLFSAPLAIYALSEPMK